MFKKIAAVALASALFTGVTASASNDFFVSAKVGASFMKLKDPMTGTSLGTKTAPMAGLAVGYNVTDDARIELGFDTFFLGKASKSLGTVWTMNPTAISSDVTEGTINGTTNTNNGLLSVTKVSDKYSARALMVRGYYDVASLDFAKVYVMAGVGMSQVSNKFSFYGYALSNPATGYATATGVSSSGSSTSVQSYVGSKIKNKNNLAISVGAGLAVSLTDGISLDAGYIFNSLGKTKSYTSGSNTVATIADATTATNTETYAPVLKSKKITSHNLVLSLRVNL